MTLEEEQIEEIRLSLREINFRLEKVEEVGPQLIDLSKWITDVSKHLDSQDKRLDNLDAPVTGVEEVYPEEEPGRVVRCCGARWDSYNLRYCPLCNETLKSGVKGNRCPCGAEMNGSEAEWGVDYPDSYVFRTCANGHAIDMGAFEPTE